MDIADIIKRCIRILHISRKPTNKEYENVAKVTAMGIIVLGVIGLILSIMLNAF